MWLKSGLPARICVAIAPPSSATGDAIVSNNLVISLYRHINAPEARMYLSRQLYEEALHIQFYLTLLDNYIPDPEQREQAFDAIENIASIRRKAGFCRRWIDEVFSLEKIGTQHDKRRFLLNLTCFATCIEGLFFFGAFHVIETVRHEEPELFDDEWIRLGVLTLSAASRAFPCRTGCACRKARAARA
jgi:ribonucleotide reductase beta subunit family protein with ferritin-like domain